MKIVDFKTEHIFKININFDKYPLYKRSIVFLHNMLKDGITKTLLDDDGSVLAFVSVMVIHKGVGSVLIMPSEKAHKEKKKSFIKGVLSLRDELDRVVYENSLRRIETLTIDEKKHNRWMEYLGFIPEGIKVAYGLNGEDYIMWSKLWQWEQKPH